MPNREQDKRNMDDVLSSSEEVLIKTKDNFELFATFFPAGSDLIIINSAVAVPRKYYKRFALYLQNLGWSVITYDYRGVGQSRPLSLRGFDARVEQWGILDAPAVIEWGKTKYPNGKLIILGHSGGGQIIGLMPDMGHVTSIIICASPKGYWKLWPGWHRYLFRAWMLIGRFAARRFGYLPLSKIGLGEDLPRQTVENWAEWSSHPEYLLGADFDLPTSGFEDFSGNMLVIGIDDDAVAPLRSVQEMAKHYTNAKQSFLWITPQAYGLKKIGHFGFFRELGREKLWPLISEWLKSQG